MIKKYIHNILGAREKPTFGLPLGLSGKELTCQCRRRGSIPELGRSPGEGNGNSLQYSFLGNPMDRGIWRATVHGIARVRQDFVTKPPTTTLRRFTTQEISSI